MAKVSSSICNFQRSKIENVVGFLKRISERMLQKRPADGEVQGTRNELKELKN